MPRRSGCKSAVMTGAASGGTIIGGCGKSPVHRYGNFGVLLHRWPTRRPRARSRGKPKAIVAAARTRRAAARIVRVALHEFETRSPALRLRHTFPR